MSTVHSAKTAPARRSLRKCLLAGAAATAALFAIAPQLVAWSPWLDELARTKMPGFQGKIHIGGGSLAWWSPSVLNDVELIAPDGEAFLTIARLTDDRTAFEAIFRPDAPSHIRVEKPVVTIKLRDDGSNVEDALRKMIELRQPSTRERWVEVVDGTCRMSSAGSNRVVEWNAIATRVHLSPAAGASNDLSLTARLAGTAQPLNVDLDLHASLAESVCHIERLTLNSDAGHLQAKGNFPVAAQTQLRPEQADFELAGELDLVRLASLLPGTLRIRDEATLTAGKVRLTATSRIENGEPRWQAHLESSKLAAEVGGETVVWDKPIQLTADIRRDHDRLVFERLTCESDLIELKGQGTSDELRLTGGCDLDQVTQRLWQFFDLGGREFQGKVTATIDLKREGDGLLEVALESTVDNLVIRELTTRMEERRRSDVEDVAQEPPAVEIPQPPPRGMRIEPRARREMAKARREAQTS